MQTGFTARLLECFCWQALPPSSTTPPNPPIPLVFAIKQGDSDLETVARDIFALTKLNYNVCKLGENQPVALKFSDAVEAILITNQGAQVRLPNFKYHI